MKITVFGAGGGEVTGSAYLVESGHSKVLIDCGLFQGVPNSYQKNRTPQEFTFRNLNAVLLTHAHLDHTGRLPILTKRKFTGSVYCTEATAELTALTLRDAARIQEGDVLRLNRRRQREGKPPLDPLYSSQDVEAIVSRFRAVPYDQPIGEKTIVRASVHSLGGFSAHAGQSDLLNWLTPMVHCRPKVFLTHGEERGREPLAACIEQRFCIKPAMPANRDTIEL